VARFLIGAAVPFFLGFSTFRAGGAGGAGLLMIAEAIDGPGASISGGAAGEAFLVRPPLLIFSEIDIAFIFSLNGVASRELLEASSLMAVGFFAGAFGVDVFND
jgi:hypothetical protein